MIVTSGNFFQVNCQTLQVNLNFKWNLIYSELNLNRYVFPKLELFFLLTKLSFMTYIDIAFNYLALIHFGGLLVTFLKNQNPRWRIQDAKMALFGYHVTT